MIVSQANNPGLLTVMLVFPALKLIAIREEKCLSKSKLPLPLGYLRWLQYIFLIISKRLLRNGLEHSSVACAFFSRPTPDSCVLSWNESFMNFTVENDHQISAFKSIFLKHFNKQILHGTLTSLSKKHSSAYRVEDKRKVLLSHHLGLTEEMLPLMRIIYRLSLREGIISVAWTDYGEVKHWIT